jgi:hypothetical protein
MNIDIAPEGPEDTAPPLVLCTKSWPTHRLPQNPFWVEGPDPEHNPDPVTGAPENPV